MATVTILKNNFTGGEISPLAQGRADLPRYANAAKSLENWIVLTQGGIQTRPGLRYVAAVKTPDKLAILKPFEPSVEDAYILEFGHEYLRFYKDGAQIVTDGPVEVETPYPDTDLRGIRTAQANDVMILVHARHQPAQLSRLSDISWSYKPVVFDPPPLFEGGHSLPATLTPSATTGVITLTASAPVFLRADVDRQIQVGDARVAITGFTSATQVTGEVLSAFTDTNPIPAGQWELLGSPNAELKPNRAQPVGGLVRLDLLLVQSEAPELVTNGAFDVNLAGWTDGSGPIIATGTHTGLANAASLTDNTKDFVALGVQPNHVVRNTTDGSRTTVRQVQGLTTVVFPETTPGTPDIFGGTDNDFDVGDAYEIRGTGSVAWRTGRAVLTGGAIGLAALEQQMTVVNGQTYRVQFDTAEGAVSAQIGTTSGGSDLVAELSYPQGNNHELVFVAEGTAAFLQFRNNQPTAGAVDNVSCKLYSVEGWRASDVGKYVLVNEGLVQLTTLASPSRMQGQIKRRLSGNGSAVPGAWTLREPSWSATLGWPSVVVFFEGRLLLAGSPRFPQTVWLSAVDDFFNFFIGPNDADALELSIVDSAGNITLNLIRWVMPSENLLVGTTHGEYRLTGPADGAFTPTELPLARLQSTFGTDTVQPLRVGQALLFAQRQGSKLRQMAFEAEVSAAFLARDLSIISGHLLENHRIVELAYQAEPLSVVWAVRSDGMLLGLTYDLLEEVVAWHHHTTQGAFESVAVIPHPTANAYQVWVTVQRTIDGEVQRFVEYFDAYATMRLPTAIDGTLASWQGLTVDAGVVYSGADTTTLSVPHLDGATVQVVGDGAVFLNRPVVNGQVTLPQPVRTAFVGLGFTPIAELLPPEAIGARGSLQRRRKRWVEFLVELYNTVGLQVNGETIPFRTAGMPMDQGVPAFTGDRLVQGLLGDGETRRPVATVVQPQPLPATVLALVGALDVESS